VPKLETDQDNLCMKFSALNVDFSSAVVADRYSKHCWRPFRGYQHWWPWTTLKKLKPKNSRILVNFFAILGYSHLKSELTLKLLEIDQDNMHIKLNW